MKRYAVYILSNRSRTLYTGVTDDLKRRVAQHRSKEIEGFTKRYAIDQLVHYEIYDSIDNAIAREKQIKGWVRAKKIDLIESNNPGLFDLTGDLYTV